MRGSRINCTKTDMVYMLLKAHSPRERFCRSEDGLRRGQMHDKYRPRRHMPFKPPVACRKIKRQGMPRQTLRKWYSRRESNPQRPLRRGLLYPFNYGSVLCRVFVKALKPQHNEPCARQNKNTAPGSISAFPDAEFVLIKYQTAV